MPAFPKPTATETDPVASPVASSAAAAASAAQATADAAASAASAAQGTADGAVVLAESAVAKSLLDAKGDLIVASGDNTPIRKAVGANDTVLTADDTAAGGMKWTTAQGGHTIQDEGSSLTQRAVMDFQGAGVSAADAGGKTVITIPGIPMVTKRITHPIGGDGTGQSSAFPGADYNMRILDKLIVTPTRFRFRQRAIQPASISDAVQTGTRNYTGIWIGAPSYTDPELRFAGTMAAAPTKVVDAFQTVDGTEFISPWITNTGLIAAHVPFALSVGWTGTGIFGLDAGRGAIWYGAGASAGAGGASPTGTFDSKGMCSDLRLEYEFVTEAGDMGTPVGLFVGCSIESGHGSDTAGTGPPTPGGCWPHEAWPDRACSRQGIVCVNASIGGSTQAFWTDTTKWRWGRLDLATTVPDFAVIGTQVSNDIATGRSLAQIKTDFNTLLGVIRNTYGIKEVYACLVPPRNFAATPEGIRTAWNAHLAGLPRGVSGVFDLDRPVRIEATPEQAHADFLISSGSPYSNPHFTRRGYEQMAAKFLRSKSRS